MKLRKKRSSSQIPVSAMGDIAFLLLIFYIATTVLTDQKPLDVDLPVLTARTQPSPFPLFIYLNRELAQKNKAYFYNEEIPVQNLHQYLLMKAASLPTSFRVYLNIQKDLPFKYMYEVIQQLKMAGIKNVIITTQGEDDID